jgi:serine/threonine-protein kinase
VWLPHTDRSSWIAIQPDIFSLANTRRVTETEAELAVIGYSRVSGSGVVIPMFTAQQADPDRISDMLGEGQQLAGYTVVRFLGAGGMGEVYLARHPRLPRRRDALKLLGRDISADRNFRDRFMREADLASTLSHQHIVGVHDRGEDQERLWIAMDYIDGEDAGQLLRRRYQAGMPAELVAAIVTAVGSALDYAHGKGLLHRDVKPANILLSEPEDAAQRRILLTDFGIARALDDVSDLTPTNTTLGTVAYSAPEQLMGHEIDGRADQYALAATAYHLLTGTTMFPASNAAVIIGHHLSAEPPPLSATRRELAALEPVLRAALAKNREDRFDSCSDFARAFAEKARSTSLAPGAPTAPAPVRPIMPVPQRPKPEGLRQAEKPAPRPPAARPAVTERNWKAPAAAVVVSGLAALGLFAAFFFKVNGSSETASPTSSPTSAETPTRTSPGLPALTPSANRPTTNTESAPPLSTTASTPRASTATSSTAAPTSASGYQFGQPLWPFHVDPGWKPTGQLSWAADPGLATLKFTQEFLGFTELDRITTVDVQSRQAWIGVGQADPNGNLRTAATVHLERLNSDAAWAVIGTEDTYLTLDVPAYGSALPPSCAEFAPRLACPTIELGGTINGANEALRIRALQVPMGGSQEPSRAVGEFCCLMAGGQRSAWSAELPFTRAPFPGPASDPPWPVTIVVSTGGHYASVEHFAITAVTTSR